MVHWMNPIAMARLGILMKTEKIMKKKIIYTVYIIYMGLILLNLSKEAKTNPVFRVSSAQRYL